MCGIFGIVGRPHPGLVSILTRDLVHRGPDDEGCYESDGIYLGHRRLSIIDLETGRQPMSNENGRYWVVYNGEIYNFRELRDRLRRCGHHFATQSDTEVIVHAWEQFGPDCVELFNGIFAFALWDAKKRRLFLARDRLGVKPLYYFQDEHRFVFSSEFRPLLNYEGVDRSQLNLSKLAEYLAFRSAGAPDTLIGGIKKLAPGSVLCLEEGSVTVDRYWAAVPRPEPMDEEEAGRELLDRLRGAVHRQLVADVPLAILLSGGIDSAVLVALAAEAREGLQTFTIEFEGDNRSELAAARRVAKKFGTRHHELSLRPADLDLVPEVIQRNDEPVAGPSSLAYFRMLEKIREYGIKVVLLGHGSDEILGGYEHLKIMSAVGRVCRVPGMAWLASTGLAAAHTLAPNDGFLARARRMVENIDADPEAAYLAINCVFDPYDLSRVLEGGVPDDLPLHPLAPHIEKGLSPPEAILAHEMGPWLADDLLLRVDRMCMAHSIEGRVPFLDNHVVDFGYRLPLSLKLRGRQEKYLLKRAMRNLLPAETIARRKQRFTTPVDSFFGSRFLSVCRRLFSDKSGLEGIPISCEYALGLLAFEERPSYRLLLRHHRLLSQYYARQIWCLFTFQLWYRTVVLGQDCRRYFS